MSLTAVSLFAGVGGFDLAMQRNGIDVVATVEIDKNARGVLQHQFPSARHFEDVTKVSGDDLRASGFVPERGIITGGFPCQDLSVAGKRAGLAGQRSGLYWEIVRLVDELAPKYLVLENVPGLLSSNGGRDMGVVIKALTDRGYGVSWRVLDAQYFGVAQRRRRVFIVGCAGDNGAASSEILALSEGLRGHLEASKPTRKDASTDAREGAVGFDVAERERERESSGELPALRALSQIDNSEPRREQRTLSSFRQRAFGDYVEDATVSAVKARDFKDATDLVVGQVTPSAE